MQAILEEAGTTMDNGKCWCIQSVFPILYDLPVYTIFTLHVLVLASLSIPTHFNNYSYCYGCSMGCT